MERTLKNTHTKGIPWSTRARWLSLAALILVALPSPASAQADGPWLIMDGRGPGYVEVPHDPALNPENITVEAWIYMMTGRTFDGANCPSLVGKSYPDSFWLGICDNRVRFYTHGGGSSRDSSGEITIGEWVHVAATYDGSDLRFYINGSLDSEFTHNLGPMPLIDRALRIGSDVSWDNRPHAAIDEVRLWSVARSQGEIAAMMNSPITSAMTGLVAVWNLNGDATDSVGGHDGSPVGNTVYGYTLPQPDPCTQEYFLTSVAHADGALGTRWFTDVSIFNLAGSTATVDLYLLPQDVDNADPVGVNLSIDPGESRALYDVVFDQFGEDDMSAALRICSDQTLLIDGRTFNAPSKATAGATYGQGIPGEEASAASTSTRRMIGLYENDQFRTNIGMLNAGAAATTVTVVMYDQHSLYLGEKVYQLPPYGYKQRSRIFNKVTTDDVENGTILVYSSDSPIFAFASVVDAGSGDGTYKRAR